LSEARRVALFMPELRRGGVEIVFLRLARGFVDAGLSVDLVVVDTGGPLANEIPDGVELVDLGRRRVLAAAGQLVRYLRRRQPDVLVSGQDHANVVAVWARRLARSPARLVLTAHSPLGSNVEGRRGFTGWLLPLAVRLSYPAADALVAVSDNVADDLVALVPGLAGRVRIISNPSIPADVSSLQRSPTGVPWLDVEGGPPVLLAVGRLDPVKDYPALLQAFAQVRSSRPARLVFVGDGAERSRLEGLAAHLGLTSDVAFVGNVSNPFPFYARARLLCMTSTYEAAPLVLVEALACSLPVVATDCGGLVSSVLRDGRLGTLVPVGNVRALAQAILSRLDGLRRVSAPAALLEPFQSRTALAGYRALFESLEIRS
jgi:glycosyltransferase involved in cell wall biosynthesis